MQYIDSGSIFLKRAYDAVGGTAPPTVNAYAAFPAVGFKPSSLVDLASDGYFSSRMKRLSKLLKIALIGKAADGQTMTCRVIGYQPTSDDIWIPQVLCEVQGTLGSRAGVGSTGAFRSDELAVDRFAAPTIGAAGIDFQATQNNQDGMAFFLLDPKGCVLFFIDLKDDASATECNALVGTD